LNNPPAVNNFRRIHSLADNNTPEAQIATTEFGCMHSEGRIHREEMQRRAVLAGDENAWRLWCLEAFDELDRFIIWRCGGRRDEADEIVQETWLTAVRQIRSFRPQQGSFLAWLRGIAANVRRNHLRRTRRLSERESTTCGTFLDNARTEVIVGRQERNQQIATALDGLLERQECVLRAKYFDGLSVAEIAAAWNESPKAIESLLSRAREAFREGFERLTRASD
jgi:RNA polymerase sigma-70 factor (ECF subfamily)